MDNRLFAVFSVLCLCACGFLSGCGATENAINGIRGVGYGLKSDVGESIDNGKQAVDALKESFKYDPTNGTYAPPQSY
jgi:hypothetical protein